MPTEQELYRMRSIANSLVSQNDLKELSHDEIRTRFTYHAPFGDQPERYKKLRDAALDLALLIDNTVPECREKSLALTKLEEAIFHANSGIARREIFVPPEPTKIVP